VAINSETWETLNPDGTKTHFEFEWTRKAASDRYEAGNPEFGSCVPEFLRYLRALYGVHWWMPLRRDTGMLKNRPIALVDCHCIDCRRSAGAPYVQWGSVPRKDVVVTKGEPRKIACANRIRSFAGAAARICSSKTAKI
jgi:hypothetical protein